MDTLKELQWIMSIEIKQDFPKHEPQYDSIGDTIRNFLSETTCHGCNKFGNSQHNRYRRMVWVLLLTVSAVFVVWYLIKEMENYYSYPFFSKTSLVSVSRIKFPAVTICNMSYKNKTKSSRNHRDEVYWFSFSPLRSLVPDEAIDWNDTYYKKQGYFEPNTFERELNDSLDLNQFFIENTFDLLPVGGFVPKITTFGLCYTWNSDGNVSTKMSGASFNLKTVINIHRDLYEWGFRSSVGIKVVVHDPKEEPDPLNQGFNLPPGVHADAKITEVRYSFLPEPFKAFAENYCVDIKSDNFVNKIHPLPYSVVSCDRFCFSEKIFERCGCIALGDIGGRPYCSHYKMLTCYFPEREKLVLDDVYDKISCECPRPCEETEYKIDLSQRLFPSDHFGKAISIIYNVPEDSMKENLIVLNLFYGDLKYFWIEQVPKYARIGDVLSNLGGQLGLFIGASILTVLEFGELLVVIVILLLKKCLHLKRKTTRVVEVTEK